MTKTTQGTKTILRHVEDGGDRNGQLATIFADTGINRMALYQDDDATNGTDLGTLQLNHLFTTATAVRVYRSSRGTPASDQDRDGGCWSYCAHQGCGRQRSDLYV